MSREALGQGAFGHGATIQGLRWLVGSLLLTGGAAAWGQQTIGSVAMQDATVSGSLEVTGGRAVLVGSSSVTARDHAAEVALARGGSVRVCQTSGLHLATGAAVAGGAPLMLALDRGAIEVSTNSLGSDVILTPDLRFAVKGKGALDLRLRVTPNGDTCVEARGSGGPTLTITETFGDASYEIHAGQHVMFEHGSLKEVVDHETSPCGCPAAPTMSIAEAMLRPNGDGTQSGAQAASLHPFPAAVSTGLAPEPGVPQAPPGAVHTQVSSTLTYEAPASGATATGQPVTSAPAAAPAQVVPEKPHGLGHAIGHFFKRIFGGS